MIEARVTHVRKRDGSVVSFEPRKIEEAVFKALTATKAGDRTLAADLARQVVRRSAPGLG